MAIRHGTNKSKNSPTYSPRYSGVTFTPPSSKKCVKCKGMTHKEGDSFYCPTCDDYVKVK